MPFERRGESEDSGISWPWNRTNDPFALRRWTQFAVEFVKGTIIVTFAWLVVRYIAIPVSQATVVLEWGWYVFFSLTCVLAVQRLIPCFFNDWLEDDWLKEADTILRYFRRER